MLSSWTKLSVVITLEPYVVFPSLIVCWVAMRMEKASTLRPEIGNSMKYLVPLSP